MAAMLFGAKASPLQRLPRVSMPAREPRLETYKRFSNSSAGNGRENR
jgi:hypothetical protein